LWLAGHDWWSQKQYSYYIKKYLCEKITNVLEATKAYQNVYEDNKLIPQ